MLFVSARNRADAFTASHALQKDCCPDGGQFIPARIPVVSKEQLSNWKDLTFAQTVCEVLNLFYTPQLDPVDVEFAIGKRPLKLTGMSHKLLVAEVWHNPKGTFENAVSKLARRILSNEDMPEQPVSWARISVWIAFLFGIYGQLLRQEQLNAGTGFDISTSSADFSQAVAAWYAKSMGLPIRTIVCGCDDAGALWDLCNHGSVNNPARISPEMEHLICGVLGQEEACAFGAACSAEKAYHISAEKTAELKQAIFPAVVSDRRMQTVIGSVYRTNAYILDPASALAFCGLMDYRVGAEETVPALLLMEKNPAHSGCLVAQALGITEKELQKKVEMI